MSIRVGRIEHDVDVLGPGWRSVVWVAGCRIACVGCVTPELWDAEAGETQTIEGLAELLAANACDGVTWSGGEPFEQAEAIAAVNDILRERRPGLSLIAYSGHRIEALRRRRGPGTVRLLSQLDLLVDGRYQPRRHAALRWRGSDNQRIHALSGRHAADLAQPDVHAGMRFSTSPTGFLFAGVPPVPDFRARLERALQIHDPDDQEGR